MLELVGEHGEELVLLLIGRLDDFQLVLLAVAALPIFGDVAGDLGEAGDFAVVVHQRIDQATEEAPRAVPAHVPALVGGLALFQGAFALGFRYAGQAVLFGVDDSDVAADHLFLAIAEDIGGAAIPAGDEPVAIHGDQRIALGALCQQPQMVLAGAQLFFGQAPVGDVDEGQHCALDAVIQRAVGQEARQVPVVAVAIADFALDQMQRFEGLRGVLVELRIIEAVGDVQQGATGVGADHVEDVPRPGREPLDAHLAVDEQGGDVRRGDQVLQVVVDLAGFVDLGLEFEVDRGELFVDRLQLFLAGFLFLGGRTQLFVDRLQFLVRGAQFVAGGFRVLHGHLQLFLGPLQFGFQLEQHAVLEVGIFQRATVHAIFDFVEDHQHVLVAGFVVLEGAHHHVHVAVPVVPLQLHPPRLDALAGVAGLA